jgi:hypothetical protein
MDAPVPAGAMLRAEVCEVNPFDLVLVRSLDRMLKDSRGELGPGEAAVMVLLKSRLERAPRPCGVTGTPAKKRGRVAAAPVSSL